MRAGYVLREVFTGLRRNVTMTLAMILTTAISLTVLGGALLVVKLTSDTKSMYGDKVYVRVYLTADASVSDPDCRQDPCQSLNKELETNPEVATVTYWRQDAAYQQAQRLFAADQGMLDLLRKEAVSAYFAVKLKNPDHFKVIADTFHAKPGVEAISDDREAVEFILNLLSVLRNITILIASVVGLAALLLISNMVQVAAFTRRTETSIMRLVGASRWRTQLPFMIEAVVAGLIGAALAVGGLFAFKHYAIDRAFGAFFGRVLGRVESTTMVWTSLGLLGIGAVLSAIAAYVTLRLYVRT